MFGDPTIGTSPPAMAPPTTGEGAITGEAGQLLSVTQMPEQNLIIFGASHDETSATAVVSELTRLQPAEVAVEMCGTRYNRLFWASSAADKFVPHWDRKMYAASSCAEAMRDGCRMRLCSKRRAVSSSTR